MGILQCRRVADRKAYLGIVGETPPGRARE